MVIIDSAVGQYLVAHLAGNSNEDLHGLRNPFLNLIINQKYESGHFKSRIDYISLFLELFILQLNYS